MPFLCKNGRSDVFFGRIIICGISCSDPFGIRFSPPIPHEGSVAFVRRPGSLFFILFCCSSLQWRQTDKQTARPVNETGWKVS